MTLSFLDKLLNFKLGLLLTGHELALHGRGIDVAVVVLGIRPEIVL